MELQRYPLIVPVENGMRPEETVCRWADRHEVYCILDGCGEETRKAWEEIPGILLRHHIPLGLGRAVKTGLNAALEKGETPNGAIVYLGGGTEAQLAEAFAVMREKNNCVTVGAGACTDLKNRAFAVLMGIVGGKTRTVAMDTGFIGIPAAFIDKAVTLPGEGDSYVSDFLLHAKKNGLEMERFALEAGTPRALRAGAADWLRMVMTAASFILSSIASFLVDYGLFTLLFYPFGCSRTVATIIARILSSVVNFTINRKVVFHTEGRKGNLVSEVGQYYALVAAVLGLNILILGFFNEVLGIPVLFAKLLTEVILFVFNYFVQRDLIFRDRGKNKDKSVKNG